MSEGNKISDVPSLPPISNKTIVMETHKTETNDKQIKKDVITNKKKPSSFVHFIAGGAGGTIAALITCPLEVIKTRLQTSSHKSTKERPFGTKIVYEFRDLWRNEGIKGLWKGIGPNLVGIAPARALHFTTYSTSKKTLTEHFNVEEGPTVHLLSAVIAGVSVHTITSPIWVIKTRMQLQEKKQNTEPYKNSIDCARRIMKEEGIKAFYKGLVASYIGVSESAIQFMLYEKFKLFVQTQKNKAFIEPMQTQEQIRTINITTPEYLTSASLAKLIASAATYPHEVVRTRFREQRGDSGKYKGFFQALKLIGVEEGIKGLYGGMGAHMIRTVPNAAIMFLTYETVLKLLAT